MSNVISIATGLPIEIEAEQLEEIVAEETARAERQVTAAIDQLGRRLEKAQGLAAEGRLSGMILIGQDPVTGLFYTDVDLGATDRAELFAYMGVLNAILMEIQEVATMAPTIGADGKIHDPYEEPAS